MKKPASPPAAAPSARSRLRVSPHLNLVCTAIQASTPAEMLQRAADALRDTRFLEFRLDSLPLPNAVLATLKRFLSDHPGVTAIATCRRKPHGGHFVQSLTE